jgi:hypothetical protein
MHAASSLNRSTILMTVNKTCIYVTSNFHDPDLCQEHGGSLNEHIKATNISMFRLAESADATEKCT